MRYPAPPVYYLGASYKTAPLRMLEKLSVDEQGYAAFVKRLHDLIRSRHREAEIAVLGTCNRFEVYWTEGAAVDIYRGLAARSEADEETGGARSACMDEMRRALARQTGVPESELAPILDFSGGTGALEHLYRVAAGVESMVIGEHQILGQVEQALSSSFDAGAAGSVLSAVFGGALRSGRRCRRETPIGRNPRDVSTVAVQLAESLIGDLSGRQVLVAGIGEMGRLTVKALHHRGVEAIDIVNRSLERAQEAATRWSATAHSMSELRSLLETADIMIASTGSREAILSRATVEATMARRSSHPLVLIDLAIPRDVEPEVAGIPGVHLFDLDGLKEIAEAGERERRAAVPEVERIVAGELESLRSDLGELAVRPVLSELWTRAEEIRRELVRNTRESIGNLSEEQAAEIDRMSRVLTNKLLHAPSARLRSETMNGKAAEYAAVLADLFGLESGRKDWAPEGEG